MSIVQHFLMLLSWFKVVNISFVVVHTSYILPLAIILMAEF